MWGKLSSRSFQEVKICSRVHVFQRFRERQRVLEAQGHYSCKSQIANFSFASHTHKLDPGVSSGDEIERNPLCFLLIHRERKPWLQKTLAV